MAVIGTFGSFTAARLGIYASQASLNVTGNNIANINTKGYTRQRLDLASLNSTGSARYANSFNLDIGYGVLAKSVSQLRDPYLDILYRDEQASVGATEAKLKGLKQLSHILDEVGKGEGEFGVLEDQFSELQEQLQKLNDNVGDVSMDANVRSAAETLCNLFNKYANALTKTKDTLTENLKGDVKEVNSILNQIRELNVQIREAGIRKDSALELRDTRNVLIDELSSYMKIDVRYSLEKIGDYGEVEKLTISLADSGTPPIELINGIYGTQLSMPEESAARNPYYNPDLPTSNRFISSKSKLPDVIVYTNMERDAMRMPGGDPVTNDAAGSDYLEGLDPPFDPLNTNNFYDLNAKDADGHFTSGKYLILDADGETIGTTDVEADATKVDNAKKGSDTNRFWMQLAPLVDERGRYLKNELGYDITEPVDLGDNTLYGSLQSMRELLTEEGEFASAEDKLFDPDATIKRGISYYQHNLDVMARKFAEKMNEANSQIRVDANGDPVLDANGNFIYDKVLLGYETETDPDGVQRYKVNQNSQKYQDMMDQVRNDPDLKDWEDYVTRVDLTGVPDDLKEKIRQLQKDFFPLEGVAQGDTDATAGEAIFAGGVLFSNRGDGDKVDNISASNITISNSWTIGNNRVLNTKKADMLAHTTDSDNVRHIITMLNEDMEYKPGEIEEILPSDKDLSASADKTYFTGSFQDMLTNFNTILATEQRDTTILYNNYTTKALARDNDRSSVSGVDLNEEATSMMQYQKSYSAACQLMTTLDSMLDKLINGTMR